MKVTVLGVPNSAGAYCVGVERAPAALREAGLIAALRAAGAEVVDTGDLTMRRWSPDRESPFAQNVGEEAKAMLELSAAAAGLLAEGERILVLGGSCMVAVGLCAAMAERGERPRLVYIDRHLDLNTPHSTTEGSLSWMGMAHALALDGAAAELVVAAGRRPLLQPPDLVYLGADPTRETTQWEREQAGALGLAIVDQAALCDDPRGAARQALGILSPGPFVVHLDVDVLDFLDAPIAENVNGRNSGPTIALLEPALVELLSRPDCRGLSIGQLDPAHASAEPNALPRLVSALVSALTSTPRDD
ncbi:arginase (plasmid) [Rathayibacter sp. VKM Ac-2803]|uniref:Arginase n=1 Tax=Rathayibacter caricis DSM 15933 TaxID=1328867 RepID=A0A2T4UP29_9MICO|nr:MULTISPECIES: arginase family protein [Rathayibacter]MWV51447.1 arginase [Rathayibacter sp. VKM Ac-2803]PTL71278.1 arginase [Rathayibacter caricis DSM 15933]